MKNDVDHFSKNVTLVETCMKYLPVVGLDPGFFGTFDVFLGIPKKSDKTGSHSQELQQKVYKHMSFVLQSVYTTVYVVGHLQCA